MMLEYLPGKFCESCWTELAAIAGVLVLFFALFQLFSYPEDQDCGCSTCQSDRYGYKKHNGPHCWKMSCEAAKGRCQSPINITSLQAMVVPVETLLELRFSAEYRLRADEMVACNNGMFVAINCFWRDGRRPTLCGGPLRDECEFRSLVFHWGPNDHEGSEHTVDREQYGLEIQAVHVNKNTCAENIIMLSYLYQVNGEDNPYMQPLIEALANIRRPRTSYRMKPIPLAWLAPPFVSRYFVYHGSLTVPPCTEDVKWIVQSVPLNISSRQIRKFRKLMTTDGILDRNSRPVQEINNRTVYYYG